MDIIKTKKQYIFLFIVGIIASFGIMFYAFLRGGIGSFILGFIAAYIIIMGLILYFHASDNKRTSLILDKERDPQKFIDEWELLKKSYFYKGAAYQNTCKLNIAIGHMLLGQNDFALNILLNEISRKGINNKIKTIENHVQHMNIFACYLELNDLDNAKHEYENHLKALISKDFLPSNCRFIIDYNMLIYHFMSNKTVSTAKTYIEQLEYLFNAYSEKLSVHTRLSYLHSLAVTFDYLEDFEKAIKFYKEVAEKGNKLWIAEKSRERLAQIQATLL